MAKTTHHSGFSFPDHSAGVRSIGQPVQAPASVQDRAQFYAALKADKAGTTARVAANRANALQKPASKRPGASKGEYDFDCDSSFLTGGTYDPQTGDLSLDFVGRSKGGSGTWEYGDVPARLVQQLRTGDASDVFNDEIRGVYED